MKNINIFSKVTKLALVLFLLVNVGCQEFKIDSQPVLPSSIKVDALESYTFLAKNPNNVVFNISSNVSWAITSSEQWCVVTPAMSALSGLVAEVSVVVEPNDAKTSRTAVLTVKAEGMDYEKIITINQFSKENLAVIPYDEVVPTAGAKISFNIISNKAWEVIPSTQFLENIDKVSGEGNEEGIKETISIEIPANTGAKRSGKIQVKTEFETFEFEIQQDGVVIELEDEELKGVITMQEILGSKTVKIASNKEWKVEVPVAYKDWVKAEKISNDELKVEFIQLNNKLMPRKGTVLMKSVDVIPGFDGVEIAVEQVPAFYIDSDASGFVVNEETGSVKIVKKGNAIVSKFPMKKGHVTFEFDEIKMSDGIGRLVFNMWPNVGNTNFHTWLRSDKNSQFTCGGAGFDWEQKQFKFNLSELNSVKKVEFFVEPSVGDVNKVDIRLVIDGKVMGILAGKSNPYATESASEPGQIINLGLFDAAADDYFVIKSITFVEL